MYAIVRSCCHSVIITHIKGTNNLLSDFASRNSVACTNTSCSVCKFVEKSTDISVYSVSVSEILNGNVRPPFSSPAAWLQIQLNCPAIQLARKHIQQGTQPMKKQRNIKEVRHLLRICSVTKDGLLVVSKHPTVNIHLQSFPQLDLIVVPSSYAPGLLTTLHLQLNHPSSHQLGRVFNRQFYTPNSDKLIRQVADNCHQCLSLRNFPKPKVPDSTSAPYSHVGSNFSADIINRSRQKILVLCEEVTKFTGATMIESETHVSVLQGLKELLLPLHPPCSPSATLKLDPAPAMQTLFRLQPLQDINVLIELGESKNPNKMATIDKQIQELENELIRVIKRNNQLSRSDLSISVANLNSRIRSCGLSSFEQWHHRSQFDKKVIHFDDDSLINSQANNRNYANTKSNRQLSSLCFQIGSIVYIRNEKDKLGTRPRYIVDRIDGVWLYLRKLTDSQIRSKTYKVHKNACIKTPDPSPCQLSTTYPDIQFDVNDPPVHLPTCLTPPTSIPMDTINLDPPSTTKVHDDPSTNLHLVEEPLHPLTPDPVPADVPPSSSPVELRPPSTRVRQPPRRPYDVYLQ